MKKGLFGTIHKRYERKGQKAIDFLVKKKEGEVRDAVYHPKIGWIDIVWGYAGTGKGDGLGLSKIVKYHPSVVNHLADTIKDLKVKSTTDNRYKLENERYFAVISRVYYETSKIWLLTMFEKK